ncbi:aldo/keto reductase [Verticiella sediminum]|uniref:Aldo/keto reductase n=1 Tax=Verticiella sediminum TaxID=1247510 RepID=A0A556AIP6_9BURK|nr:aldo/keto reductase [Verticiella sediminum]TSH92735.1 aldo/keto reductase [Verticiella sediminum]
MTSRRDACKIALALGAGAALGATPLHAASARASELITRPIPRTGERLPAVGLGSSATFSSAANTQDAQRLREVLEALLAQGGTVFDTAPSYGASEEVAGTLAQQAGIADKLFWATKLNVAQGGKADPQQARAQIEESFRRIGRPVIDLIQVHNVADVPTQYAILKELREAGRIRYAGVTNTFSRNRDTLVHAMQTEPLDFIGIDYAIDNRDMEERVLPLAADRGIAVLAYAPFGRTRLWDRVRGRTIPPWAAELGIASWAQFFLKFVLSHPVITCATPATSRPANAIDNLGAMRGELPDAAMRERMAQHIADL